MSSGDFPKGSHLFIGCLPQLFVRVNFQRALLVCSLCAMAASLLRSASVRLYEWADMQVSS